MQYRRHDNREKHRGLLWHIKNPESVGSSSRCEITLEDIREWKRQLDLEPISNRQPLIFKDGERAFKLYGGHSL